MSLAYIEEICGKLSLAFTYNKNEEIQQIFNELIEKKYLKVVYQKPHQIKLTSFFGYHIFFDTDILFITHATREGFMKFIFNQNEYPHAKQLSVYIFNTFY